LELEKFISGTRDAGQFNDFTKDPQLWIASSNRFFVSIIRPLPVSGTPPKMFTLSDGTPIPEVHHVASANIDVMAYGAKPWDNQGVIRFTGNTVDVGPGATVA